MAKREPRWAAVFLKQLEQTGNVRLAAERAGVDFTTAYQRRKRHSDFAGAWEGALQKFKGRAIAVLQEGHGDKFPAPSPGSPEASPTSSALGGGELGFRPDGKVARVGEGRWTERSQEAFLVALTTSGSVSRAAKAAGFSTAALYKRRLKDRRFAQAWDAALETGKARVQSYLVEAATRTFDPDELPIAPDHEIPKVTVGEAINIAKLPVRGAGAPGGPGRGRGGPGFGHGTGEWDEEPSEEEQRELRERILFKLEGLKSRHDREMEAAGWTEHELPPMPCYNSDSPTSVWIPPGWRLLREGE